MLDTLIFSNISVNPECRVPFLSYYSSCIFNCSNMKVASFSNNKCALIIYKCSVPICSARIYIYWCWNSLRTWELTPTLIPLLLPVVVLVFCLEITSTFPMFPVTFPPSWLKPFNTIEPVLLWTSFTFLKFP